MKKSCSWTAFENEFFLSIIKFVTQLHILFITPFYVCASGWGFTACFVLHWYGMVFVTIFGLTSSTDLGYSTPGLQHGKPSNGLFIDVMHNLIVWRKKSPDYHPRDNRLSFQRRKLKLEQGMLLYLDLFTWRVYIFIFKHT